MSNDIDLWRDIKQVVKFLKRAKTKKDKLFWYKEHKKLWKEWKEKYI